MKISKEYIDQLIKKAGLENSISIYNSAIEICTSELFKTFGTPLPEEDGGYQVLAMILDAALNEVMELIENT